MRARFAGGVHPDPRKAATERLPIVDLPPPALAVIPLQQHIGPKSRALVKAGDLVRLGQKIGEAEGFVAAHVHASIAGKVTTVSLQPHPMGTAVEAVVIENDGTDAPASCETHSWETSTPEALREHGAGGRHRRARRRDLPDARQARPPEGEEDRRARRQRRGVRAVPHGRPPADGRARGATSSAGRASSRASSGSIASWSASRRTSRTPSRRCGWRGGRASRWRVSPSCTRRAPRSS